MDVARAGATHGGGRRLVGVALLYTAITIALAAPFSLHPGTRVLSGGTDTDLYVWTLGWDVHAFTHQPWAIFNANIFFPHLHTLAYSENLIGSAFLAAPILWLSKNPVLAMNLVALGACVLAALGAYVLAGRLGLSPAAATIAGIVFAFTPAKFLRLDQFHLITIEWVPWGLACFHRYLDEGLSRDLKWTVALFTLQALTSGHGAVFLVVALLSLAGYRWVAGAWHSFRTADPADLRGRPTFLKRARDLGVTGALLLLPTVLTFLPYRAAQSENASLRRTLVDWDVNAAAFFASPSRMHTWLLSYAPAWMTSDPSAYLFPGIVPIALALCAISRARPLPHDPPAPLLRRHALFYALLLLLCVWLMLGPPIGLWRFVYWLPGLNFIRVPSRFILLGVLALGVLAAAGFERLTSGLSARGRAAAAIVVGALLLGEFWAGPIPGEAYQVQMPAADRWLASRPTPFAIAEVPLPDSRDITVEDRRLTLFMQHSMAHWQKTVHGYSGIEPPEYRALYWKLVQFPDEDSLRALTDLGVTYVVVHFDLFPPVERPGNEARYARWSNRLTLEYADADARVYSIRPP